MYKSELVPPRMALVGMIGGPLAFVGGVLALFGVFDRPSAGSFVFTAPEIVWEAFIAIYWTFVGFRRSSPLLPCWQRPSRSRIERPATWTPGETGRDGYDAHTILDQVGSGSRSDRTARLPCGKRAVMQRSSDGVAVLASQDHHQHCRNDG
jgi:hypothetical protein